MSWKDGFSAKGSFKGAEFYVREHELETGRRVQVHEYPNRDKPYAEDLGRKARRLQFDAYCIGPNYHLARDKLIAVAEEGGAGTLVHPYHGTLTATITSFRVRETTRNGGFAEITIQAVEAGEEAFPSVTTPTQSVVREAARQTTAEAIRAFARTFAIQDTAKAVNAFLQEVDNTIGASAELVAGISAPLADMIRAPAELGASIAGAITNVSSIATEPQRAMRIYQNLFTPGFVAPPVNRSPRARQAARNSQALQMLTSASAIAAACNSTADLELSPARQGDNPITQEQVYALRDDLLSAIDTLQECTDVVSGQPIDDQMYLQLADLRKAVATDLSTRGSRLPAVIYRVPTATLPALVLAHNYHGDASRETEIVNLNRLRHPGFVPGGAPLQLLSDEGAQQ